MTMDRREFLAGSAALAASSSLPVSAFAQESMITREIPGTGERLPAIGLGAPDIFIDWPPEGRDLPRSVLQAMVDSGGRLLDTPAFFRPDVPVVGQLLDEMGLQDELFLSGKITVNTKEAGIEHLEKTVANLNKQPMDLLLIHNMRNLHEHWATLKDWKEAGRVRYIGISLTRNSDYAEMERFMRAERPDFIMTGYSIHHPLAAETTLPLAADLGIAVLIVEAFKATEDGGIFPIVAGRPLPEWAAEHDIESWAQYSLKYILSNPAVTGIVTETRQVRHVIDNMRGGYGRLPDEAARRRMSDYLLSI
ncbi:MAG: aldo/keto reductase [Gammaproteobacteria bacterium]|nr:aldo/keto reductase [Gammaproteobacteria bacterium]